MRDVRVGDWGSRDFRRQYQRDYRVSLRQRGFKRLDLWLDARLWERLYPLMDPACRDSHPGAAIYDLLERVFPE